MGCDIHMCVEFGRGKSRDEDQLWDCFGSLYNPGRDYRMFGALAGVRDGEIECPYPQRGLPKGEMSFEAKNELSMEDQDLHSHSWLTADEYAHVYGVRMMNDEWGPPDMGYELIMVVLQAMKERNIPARVVFAFDN